METRVNAEKKYFGWFQPTPGGTYTLAHSKKEFKQELWDEFSRIVGIVAELRPFVIDYLSLVNAFEALQGVAPTIVEEMEGTPHILMFTGVPQTRALALQRARFRTSSERQARSKTVARPASAADTEAIFWRPQNSKPPHRTRTTPFSPTGYFTTCATSPCTMRCRYPPSQVTRAEDGTHKVSMRLILRPQELLESHLIQKTFRENELVHQTGEIR